MKALKNRILTILFFIFFLGVLSFAAQGKTSGIISLDFPDYLGEDPHSQVITERITKWEVEGQSETKITEDGLKLDKEGAKLTVEFELPLHPNRAVLHVVHRAKKPESVELKNTPSVRYKANGEYLDQHVETEPPGMMQDNYHLDRWQMSRLLQQGKNTLTFHVPNDYTNYYVKQLTIAYNKGRFRTSDVIHATTVWNQATLEYKKAFKGNMPGIAFYFYTLQSHKFIGGGEIYLDRLYVIPSTGERLELPYTQPASAGILYFNYLGPEITDLGLNSLRMVGALNGSISSLESALVRNDMPSRHAKALTHLAQEIFNSMAM